MASAGTQSINNTNKEDYTDILSVVEPTKTPLFSSIKKGAAPTNVKHEWTVDDLDAVRVKTTPEGHDLAEFDNAGKNRQRLSGYITIMTEGWRVTDIQMKSNPAGVDDMAAKSKAKKLAEWKRNAAARFGGDYEQNDGSNGQDYASRGLGNWILATAQSVNPVPAAYRTPANSINTTATNSLTESSINDVITSIWTAGGERTNGSLYANTNLKVGISGLSRSTSQTQYHINESADSNTITRSVDIFKGDFGVLKVVPDLFIGYGGTDASRLARGYFVDPELLELNWMIPLGHINGQDEGGGPRGTWKGAVTMTCKNPRGFGAWKASS